MKKALFLVFLFVFLLMGCRKPVKYKATLIEFMDRGCPACEALQPVMEELEKEYKGLVDFQIFGMHLSLKEK